MPTPVTGLTGPGADRATATSADLIAEARQRHADRLRAAQAENVKPTEVVEAGVKSDTAENDRKAEQRQAKIQPYRVNLDPATRRLYTEVLDTETGAVIMRIPDSYADPAPGGPEADGDADRAPDREVKA